MREGTRRHNFRPVVLGLVSRCIARGRSVAVIRASQCLFCLAMLGRTRVYRPFLLLRWRALGRLALHTACQDSRRHPDWEGSRSEVGARTGHRGSRSKTTHLAPTSLNFSLGGHRFRGPVADLAGLSEMGGCWFGARDPCICFGGSPARRPGAARTCPPARPPRLPQETVVWNATAGEVVRRFASSPDWTNDVAVAPGGDVLVTCGSDQARARARGGRRLGRRGAALGHRSGVALSPPGRRL